MTASSLQSRILGRTACVVALTSIFAVCQIKAEELAGGKNPDDLAGYRKVEAPQLSVPVIINPRFADGTKGWSVGKGFRAAPGNGVNGTGALFTNGRILRSILWQPKR